MKYLAAAAALGVRMERIVPLIVLAAATVSCGGSKPQQSRVTGLSTQQLHEAMKKHDEEMQARVKAEAEAMKKLELEMQARVKAEARRECLKAKALLRQDCKDLTATMDCRNFAVLASQTCGQAGMPIRLPRLDSVGCLGTGPFPSAPPPTSPIRRGYAGLLDNYTCQRFGASSYN